MGRRSGALGWFVEHWRGVGLVWAGLVVGGTIGWWAGSFTACASGGCQVRVDSIGALGTWVGGLGTIAAVLAAVVAFKGEEDARREEIARLGRTRREQMDRDEEEANRIVVSAQINSTAVYSQVRSVTEFTIAVANNARTSTAHDLTAFSSEWGQIARGCRLDSNARPVSKHVRLGSDRGNQRPEPFPEPQDHAAWSKEVVEGVTIDFEMNDQRWRRVGNTPVERVIS